MNLTYDWMNLIFKLAICCCWAKQSDICVSKPQTGKIQNRRKVPIQWIPQWRVAGCRCELFMLWMAINDSNPYCANHKYWVSHVYTTDGWTLLVWALLHGEVEKYRGCDSVGSTFFICITVKSVQSNRHILFLRFYLQNKSLLSRIRCSVKTLPALFLCV